MSRRTFGWVQNPGDLTKLKRVTSIFLSASEDNLWLREKRLPLLLDLGLITKENYDKFQTELAKANIYVKYNELKGKGSGCGSRSSAICSGIVQAVIDGQQNKTYQNSSGQIITIKKPYTDDWSAEGYIRWAVSCGLLEYVRDDDSCKLTPLGIDLAKTKVGTPEEKEALTKALLSYPPVIRVLSILEQEDEQTKFDIGRRLGFKGEMGFTSIPLGMYLCDYSLATTSAER